MKNNQLDKIKQAIDSAESILLYPHANMDGDTLGSAVALCKALRKMEKECYVLIEDEIPGNLQFLDQGYCTFDQDVLLKPDLSICIDCGDIYRFVARKEKFLTGKTSICLDHHLTTDPYCDLNYVDSSAAATGQLVFHLLKKMNVRIDKEMAEAIFVAITTDTGNFQYSNTTKETHNIVAELYESGMDSNRVSVELYENIRIEKLLIRNKALNNLMVLCEGKAVLAYVTQEMLAETGADMEETEGVVQDLRSISGVEIAAFLKQVEPNKIKVSLRAKEKANVAEIAASIGGGGHEKAAGCTLNCDLSEAFDIVKAQIKMNLEKYDH